MSLTNDQITAKNFKEFYEAIRPYLNGSFPTPIANKFDKANMYSTDEQIVGRWIDGKPLYQKTIVKNNFQIIQDASFAHGISNVEHIFIKESHLTDNGNSNIVPLIWTDSYNGIYINATNVTFKGTGTWGAETTRTIYLTVQYTKTTDTAMEIGSDTDYSTTEKIVGTWIDGKPLYQKTLDIGTLSGNDVQFSLSSVYGLTDIEHAWKVNGYLVNSGGWEYDNFYLSTNDNANITVFNTVIRVVCSGYANVTGGKVTIQYTKTTD